MTTECIAPSTYNYLLEFESRCHISPWGDFSVYFEVASEPTGPWTTIGAHPDIEFSYTVPTSSYSGVFTMTSIPIQYTWYHIRLRGRAVGGIGGWHILEGQTPGTQICYLPTPTPSVTPTATSTPTPCPLTFTDVSPTDYFYEAVRYLYCAGVISGYSDNTFRPYNNTTRGQLTKIVVLAEGWPIYTPLTPTFTDVPTTDPFYGYIETAYFRGIISGYSDGTFRPGSNVTRGQLSKIVVLAEGWPLYTPPIPTFTDVPATHPFHAYIETAYSRQIITGYSDLTFRPQNPATRGQICKIVYNALAK